MAEKTGDIIGCPACGASTPVSIDKRGKLFLNCACGLLKFNTEKGQALLRQCMDRVAPEIAEKTQENPEIEGDARAVAAAIAQAVKGDERRSAGLAILGIFGILSGGAWWILKNRARQ